MIRKRKRLWAMLLSAALIVTQLPAVAMAENHAPEDGSIESFEELPSGVAEQTVPVGTELSGLTLPDTVTATVYHVTEDTVISDEDESGDSSTATPSDAKESISENGSKDSSIKDSGETVTTVTTSTEEIPVTWGDGEPTYNGDTEGKYVFTADAGGYALSSGAKLPEITVTVSSDTAKPLPCTKTEGCTLVDGHEGECVTAPPANDAIIKTITDWTFVDDGYLNKGELSMPGVSADNQADFDTVVSMLPTQISADIDSEADKVPVDITGWTCAEYTRDKDGNWPLAGNFTFTAALPAGYACDPAPTVRVTLGGGDVYEFGGLTISGTSTATQEADGQIKLTQNGDYEISGTWSGTLDGVDRDNKKAVITVSSGVTANVTLNGATITKVSGTDYASAFAVANGGTANITLTGTNTLTSGRYRAGLEVPDGANLTIDGSGSLTATGGGSGAGVGGSRAGGTINITGGTVNANGGTDGSGIGGGARGAGGTISITGGTVNANGISFGAGIGGGSDGAGGTISITGGTVNANGGSSGAGIGGGAGIGTSNNGQVEISGHAVVNATGGDFGAGIGGGFKGDGGNITVSGNTVVFANGGGTGVNAIGGGKSGSDTTAPTLTEGVVFKGKNGAVYGSPELPGDITIPASSTLTIPDGSTLTIPDGSTLTIPDGSTLTIPDGSTLTIASGATLTGGGTIVVEPGGVLDVNGTLGAGIKVVYVYRVTVVDGSGGGLFPANEQVSIAANPAPAGQVFDRWTTADGVTFANENAASTTFTMPAKAVTVTATYKNSGGSSSGGSSSGSGRSLYSEPEPQSSYTVAGDSISRSVSRYDLKKLADSGKSLTLSCDKASMTFDPAALKAILAAVPATAGNITFAAAPADLSAFPDSAKQIGDHPAYDFTISYKDGNGNTVTVPVNFPAGSAAITLIYPRTAAETEGSLFMVYVDGKGAMTWLDKSSYDNGRVMAEVPHFSTYGVAYKTPAPVFTDISGHWAKEDIEFAAARGLLSGTGEGLFSPDGTMTRGMFVTALGRLAGVNPADYQTRSFTDVKADAYYAAYVEWAAQKNIAGGTGDKLFSPDNLVTREQLAVIMTNYAGQMGYAIPTPLAEAAFADSDKISEWAAKEVTVMQRAGIVKGRDGNRFDPQASATRAEVSAVLRRFVEIVIDPATATGWVKNDSGHWLYYKNGAALTGWQTIGKLRYFFNADGVMHEGWKQDEANGKWYYWTNAGAATGWREIDGKWYYFDENGVMAVNTKIDGYEVGPDGVRKEV